MKLRLSAVLLVLLLSAGAASATTIQTFSSGAVNLAIPDNSPGTPVTSTITLPGIANPDSLIDLTVTVAIDHSYVGDLEITLTAPDLTTVSLLIQPGDATDTDGSFFGTSTNLSSSYPISFNDLFTSVAEDIGSGCASADTVGLSIGCSDDEYAPHTPLSAVYGNFAGNWVLSVADTAVVDTGTLVEWSLTAEFERDGAPVPEPSAAVVFGIGFALMTSRSRRGRV